MENQFTKQQLIDGKEFTFESEEDILEIWHSAGGPNWKDPFQGMFNGEFFSFKTFNGLNNKAKYFIKTYKLKQQEEDEEV